VTRKGPLLKSVMGTDEKKKKNPIPKCHFGNMKMRKVPQLDQPADERRMYHETEKPQKIKGSFTKPKEKNKTVTSSGIELDGLMSEGAQEN